MGSFKLFTLAVGPELESELVLLPKSKIVLFIDILSLCVGLCFCLSLLFSHKHRNMSTHLVSLNPSDLILSPSRIPYLHIHQFQVCNRIIRLEVYTSK